MSDVSNIKEGIEGAIKFLQKLDFYKINSTGVSNAINYSLSQGPAAIRNRYPNFIALDFFEEGNSFKIIDGINKKTKENPTSYYRPIQIK